MEGAMRQLAHHRLLGHPALLVDLEAVRDSDHAGGLSGERTLGRPSQVRLLQVSVRGSRVSPNIRELAMMSYFEHCFNPAGEKTLRGYSRPVNFKAIRQASLDDIGRGCVGGAESSMRDETHAGGDAGDAAEGRADGQASLCGGPTGRACALILFTHMSENVLLTEVRDRVATLTLNRPDKLNAINVALLEEAGAILKKWSRDPEIGAIVVTGSGRAFCAGGDVSMMAREDDSSTLEQKIDGLRDMQEISWLLYSSPKVTIASVNGFAMGAGLGIALACDLRIASSAAKFGTAYAKVGYGERVPDHTAADSLRGRAEAERRCFFWPILLIQTKRITSGW